MKFYRGRLIDHVHIVSRNLAASKRFYKAVFSELEIPLGAESDERFWCDELFVSSTDCFPEAKEPTGPIHLAFQARDPEMVKRFYASGLAAGGVDDGAPGERRYHPGYYAAYLVDPDGNFIEAVYHGPANRSAVAVELTQ